MEFHKYSISKKGFWRRSFEIFEDNVLKYTVKCPGWIAYNHLIFIDAKGTEDLVIERFHGFFNRRFEFLERGGLKAVLTKSSFSNKYTLESDVATYIASSNWLGNEYTVFLGDEDIAKVSRKMMTNHKQYGIAIIEGNHNLFILGMIICIELIRMTNNKG